MKLSLPRNPIALVGVLLATTGAFLFLAFWVLELLGRRSNPYAGMVFLVILPAIFVLGLLLIPVGLWRDRVRRRAGAELGWPRVDLNNPRHRNVAFFLVIATFVNILIVSMAAYSGLHYMEQSEFCGQVCHSVMEPEFAAFQNSAHSQVGCVKCHVGPGASGLVASKMSGLRQVVSLTFNRYARPVPAPVHNLVPARETCEQCHWAEKFHGDKTKIVREFAADETNTESTQTLKIKVGGGNARLSIASGIHWHMNINNVVEYVATDDKRQVIPWVKITDRDGNVREYTADGVTPEEIAKGERRTMDCIDCHNRPGHMFDPTADKAVNRALATGTIPLTLPFIKREAVAALGAEYPSAQVAEEKIAQRLRDFYQKNYAQLATEKRQDVDRAVAGTQALYKRNIFPQMKIGWGTYPNNIGHMDSSGCFRCHDDNHKTKAGKTIGQDCALCHDIQ
jgi:nitrate/TMAO reductase-like tetraheme cytochrome c subunit